MRARVPRTGFVVLDSWGIAALSELWASVHCVLEYQKQSSDMTRQMPCRQMHPHYPTRKRKRSQLINGSVHDETRRHLSPPFSDELAPEDLHRSLLTPDRAKTDAPHTPSFGENTCVHVPLAGRLSKSSSHILVWDNRHNGRRTSTPT